MLRFAKQNVGGGDSVPDPRAFLRKQEWGSRGKAKLMGRIDPALIWLIVAPRYHGNVSKATFPTRNVPNHELELSTVAPEFPVMVAIQR